MCYTVWSRPHISKLHCSASISSYNFVKMKRRRDDKSQKITAFLSSAPPTKRTSGVEDGGVPNSSSSEDQNQPTSSEEQRKRERHATASANTAKHKTGYNRTWEADPTWVFYIDGEGMYCKLCLKFDTKNRQNQAKVWNTELCRGGGGACFQTPTISEYIYNTTLLFFFWGELWT